MKQEIIQKWYKELDFSPLYNEEFYKCLQNVDVSDLTDFSSCDYKNNSSQKNLLACLYFCEQKKDGWLISVVTVRNARVGGWKK